MNRFKPSTWLALYPVEDEILFEFEFLVLSCQQYGTAAQVDVRECLVFSCLVNSTEQLHKLTKFSSRSSETFRVLMSV